MTSVTVSFGPMQRDSSHRATSAISSGSSQRQMDFFSSTGGGAA